MRPWLLWSIAWLLLAALGAWAIAAQARNQQREAFDNQVRIAHRLLSQRAAQHEAVLATLALLQPRPGTTAVQRMPALYPQILQVQQLGAGQTWPSPVLQSAQAISRQERRAVLAHADLGRGRAWLLLAAEPASFALEVDLLAAVPWSEWPMRREDSPVRLWLEQAGQALVLQPGRAQAQAAARFEVRKPLASTSLPVDVVAARDWAWKELPWTALLAWAAASALFVGVLAAWQRQRAGRRRAEELLRLGQVARLNALGELAAGLAHELNQPLTAVLANTQAARRMLDDEPAELAPAREAMAQAAQQARRASDVVGRLRRTIERPAADAGARPVVLQDAVRDAFDLLAPEFTRRGVEPALQAAPPVRVQAEPVALEQIVHNLLMNALQALDQVPPAERELIVDVEQRADTGVLSVADSGPGIAPELLPRIFEPFVTSRADGLGLGLSLCESLATQMGGSLQAQQRPPRGAVFRLALPRAA